MDLDAVLSALEGDRQSDHDVAMAEAPAATYLLGVALAGFQTAIEKLGDATPKCACGFALLHMGPHRR